MLNQPLDVPAPGVLANDHDVEVEDTAPLHAQLRQRADARRVDASAPTARSATLPAADFLGIDSFTYTSVDHFDAVSVRSKTVTLTVAIKAVSQTVGERRDG